MSAAKVEEVEWFLDRINRIYRIEIGEVEKPFDVSNFNGWAVVAEVGANPVGFCRAGSDNLVRFAKEVAFNRRD